MIVTTSFLDKLFAYVVLATQLSLIFGVCEYFTNGNSVTVVSTSFVVSPLENSPPFASNWTLIISQLLRFFTYPEPQLNSVKYHDNPFIPSILAYVLSV